MAANTLILPALGPFLYGIAWYDYTQLSISQSNKRTYIDLSSILAFAFMSMQCESICGKLLCIEGALKKSLH